MTVRECVVKVANGQDPFKVLESIRTLEASLTGWLDDITQDAFDHGYLHIQGKSLGLGREKHVFMHDNGNVLLVHHGPHPQDRRWAVQDTQGKMLHVSNPEDPKDLFLDIVHGEPPNVQNPERDSKGRVKGYDWLRQGREYADIQTDLSRARDVPRASTKLTYDD
jgi:hypothetical protein